MKTLTPVLLSFLLASCGTTEVRLTNSTALTGNWTGSYLCAQGPTGLTLTVTGSTSGQTTAVFNFYPLPVNPDVPIGSFNMIGSYNSLGELALAAGDWIKRPGSYITVNLSGKVANNLYQGNVISPQGSSDCTTFSLTKE